MSDASENLMFRDGRWLMILLLAACALFRQGMIAMPLSAFLAGRLWRRKNFA